ncbi:MAG: hypothetical protein ACRENY_07835 [Candidatus Dormibacteria bacterium]
MLQVQLKAHDVDRGVTHCDPLPAAVGELLRHRVSQPRTTWRVL